MPSPEREPTARPDQGQGSAGSSEEAQADISVEAPIASPAAPDDAAAGPRVCFAELEEDNSPWPAPGEIQADHPSEAPVVNLTAPQDPLQGHRVRSSDPEMGHSRVSASARNLSTADTPRKPRASVAFAFILRQHDVGKASHREADVDDQTASDRLLYLGYNNTLSMDRFPELERDVRDLARRFNRDDMHAFDEAGRVYDQKWFGRVPEEQDLAEYFHFLHMQTGVRQDDHAARRAEPIYTKPDAESKEASELETQDDQQDDAEHKSEDSVDHESADGAPTPARPQTGRDVGNQERTPIDDSWIAEADAERRIEREQRAAAEKLRKQQDSKKAKTQKKNLQRWRKKRQGSKAAKPKGNSDPPLETKRKREPDPSLEPKGLAKTETGGGSSSEVVNPQQPGSASSSKQPEQPRDVTTIGQPMGLGQALTSRRPDLPQGDLTLVQLKEWGSAFEAWMKPNVEDEAAWEKQQKINRDFIASQRLRSEQTQESTSPPVEGTTAIQPHTRRSGLAQDGLSQAKATTALTTQRRYVPQLVERSQGHPLRRVSSNNVVTESRGHVEGHAPSLQDPAQDQAPDDILKHHEDPQALDDHTRCDAEYAAAVAQASNHESGDENESSDRPYPSSESTAPEPVSNVFNDQEDSQNHDNPTRLNSEVAAAITKECEHESPDTEEEKNHTAWVASNAVQDTSIDKPRCNYRLVKDDDDDSRCDMTTDLFRCRDSICYEHACVVPDCNHCIACGPQDGYNHIGVHVQNCGLIVADSVSVPGLTYHYLDSEYEGPDGQRTRVGPARRSLLFSRSGADLRAGSRAAMNGASQLDGCHDEAPLDAVRHDCAIISDDAPRESAAGPADSPKNVRLSAPDVPLTQDVRSAIPITIDSAAVGHATSRVLFSLAAPSSAPTTNIPATAAHNRSHAPLNPLAPPFTPSPTNPSSTSTTTPPPHPLNLTAPPFTPLTAIPATSPTAQPPPTGTCDHPQCNIETDLWRCTECQYVHCSANGHYHGVEHFKRTSHVECEPIVWREPCDEGEGWGDRESGCWDGEGLGGWDTEDDEGTGNEGGKGWDAEEGQGWDNDNGGGAWDDDNGGGAWDDDNGGGAWDDEGSKEYDGEGAKQELVIRCIGE